jgi:hypothetical protein
VNALAGAVILLAVAYDPMRTHMNANLDMSAPGFKPW